jgi:hypothetical protein
MGLLDSIKIDENLKLYLESVNRHVLQADMRLGELEANFNMLKQDVESLEEELNDGIGNDYVRYIPIEKAKEREAKLIQALELIEFRSLTKRYADKHEIYKAAGLEELK